LRYARLPATAARRGGSGRTMNDIAARRSMAPPRQQKVHARQSKPPPCHRPGFGILSEVERTRGRGGIEHRDQNTRQRRRGEARRSSLTPSMPPFKSSAGSCLPSCASQSKRMSRCCARKAAL
jgi:hypothetical protein